MDKAAFELLLCSLYGKDYEQFHSVLNPRQDGQARACLLARCGVLLTLEFRLDIPSLREEAMGRIQSINDVDYASIVKVAQKVFRSTTTPNPEFESLVSKQIQMALQVHNLEDEIYVLDAISDSGGPLCLELFKSLRDRRSQKPTSSVFLGSQTSFDSSDNSDMGQFAEQVEREIECLSLEEDGVATETAQSQPSEEANEGLAVVDVREDIESHIESKHETSIVQDEEPARPANMACPQRELHLVNPTQWKFCGRCCAEIVSIVRYLRNREILAANEATTFRSV